MLSHDDQTKKTSKEKTDREILTVDEYSNEISGGLVGHMNIGEVLFVERATDSPKTEMKDRIRYTK